MVKNPSVTRERQAVMSSIPGLRRSPGGGPGNRLQYSCLENPMDRGEWWVRVYRVTKNQIGMSKCRAPGGRGAIPGSGRSPGGGNGNPLQYSCQADSMSRGSWWATVHGVAKESDMTEPLSMQKILIISSWSY